MVLLNAEQTMKWISTLALGDYNGAPLLTWNESGNRFTAIVDTRVNAHRLSERFGEVIVGRVYPWNAGVEGMRFRCTYLNGEEIV
jgi:hypothetical protein